MSTLLNFGFTKPNKQGNNDAAEPGPSSQSDENNNTSNSFKVSTKRTFSTRRLSKYRWLIFDDATKGMKCKFCVASKRNNPFALDGSYNFQRSALEIHECYSGWLE